MNSGLVVTIDGPAGTGKSTVARLLAQTLGIHFLDTGAMYRAVALMSIEAGVRPDDASAVSGLLCGELPDFDFEHELPRVQLGSRDVSARIRDDDVTAAVSPVSVHPAVRPRLVELQRAIAARWGSLVTEGRDQGSVVFPDAAVRFYLDAPAETRAQRRVEQLRAEGRRAEFAQVLSSICARDRIDSTRADGPLTRPIGAIVVQTAALTLEEVVARLLADVRARATTAGRQ